MRTLPTGSSKACLDCNEARLLEELPARPKRADRRGSYCKVCLLERSRASCRKRMAATGRTRRTAATTTASRAIARGEASKKRHHGSTRNYHLKARYGITEAEADEMLEAPGGLCAICEEQPAVHVDHDHLFGNVRGLTCFNCNGGLGQFKDRVDIMRKAIDYLERTRSTQWQRTSRSMGVYQLTSPRREAASPPSSGLQHLISSRRS